MNHDGPPETASCHRDFSGAIHVTCAWTAVSARVSPDASPDTGRPRLKKNGCGSCAVIDPPPDLEKRETSTPTARFRQTRTPPPASKPAADRTVYVVFTTAGSANVMGRATSANDVDAP